MHEPKRWQAREAILASWGRRCQLLLFIAGRPRHTDLRTPRHLHPLAPNALYVQLDLDEAYATLWRKTRLAFQYIAQHHFADFDWVIKIDDDSFLIAEHLRLFLATIPQQHPRYFGLPYHTKGGYNSGGPGYVLSRHNTRQLIKSFAMPACASAEQRGIAEDVEIGKCLRLLGVIPADTRDHSGAFRFSPFEPIQTMHHHLVAKKHSWFWGFTKYPLPKQSDCCSATFISFHYVKPDLMLTLEFLLYGLHPFSQRDFWRFTLVPSLRNATTT